MRLTERLCFGCHELRSIAYVDPTDRGYCAECVIALPNGSAVRAMGFRSLTIPFKVGDRVHAYSGGELDDGIGHVAKVSFDLEHGTPVEPTFRVVIDEPLFQGKYGRIRTVVEGPDGALYALTSNRDGRGSPREGDDRLLRIVPPAA